VSVGERRLTGRAAAPGICVGPVVLLAHAAGARRVPGSPDAERKALLAAIHAAHDEVAALAAKTEGDAARIIEFQVALLEDDALSEAAREAIAGGAAADTAWHDAMAQEIAGYQQAEDEYFRARGADLADVRDRVQRHLAGAPAAPEVPPGAIVVARELPPSVFLGIDWSKGGGIILGEGSPTSHVAMLARSRDVPMVVGLGPQWESLAGTVILDGESGYVVADPLPQSIARAERSLIAASLAKTVAGARVGEPAVTRDGTRIAVMINVAGPAEVAKRWRGPGAHRVPACRRRPARRGAAVRALPPARGMG
jgi:phosphotransferase system enzyme I (PtsI)